MKIIHRPDTDSSRRSAETLGRLIARAHYQAWRSDAPPLDLTVDELAAIMSNLIKSGSAGLIWPRVEPVRERYGALAFALEAAYNSIRAYNERAQEAIASVVGRLNDAGIEPILVKGWSMSRLYPDPLLRPAGDIDLEVPNDQLSSAKAIIAEHTPLHGIDIDLKCPATWKERPSEDFWDRAVVISVGGTSVRVLGAEDNLRMLCFHFLKHGGQRPLWLCDFAAAVEGRPADFDWRRCLGSDATEAGWVSALISLTHDMVGTSHSGVPLTTTSPEWLESAIVDQWLSPRDVVRRGALTQIRANPRAIFGILAEAWPTRISALFWGRAPINSRFLVSWQIREFTRRFRDHVRLRLIGQLKHQA